MKIAQNDNVLVASGKDKGKSGKVLTVIPNVGKITIAGVNLTKRHVRPSKKFPNGGRFEYPAPIDASNVLLICPSCKKAARVSYTRDKSGVHRICKKCGKPVISGSSK